MIIHFRNLHGTIWLCIDYHCSNCGMIILLIVFFDRNGTGPGFSRTTDTRNSGKATNIWMIFKGRFRWVLLWMYGIGCGGGPRPTSRRKSTTTTTPTGRRTPRGRCDSMMSVIMLIMIVLLMIITPTRPTTGRRRGMIISPVCLYR